MDLNQIIQDAIIEPNKNYKKEKIEFVTIKPDLQAILDKYLTKKVENLSELQDIQKVFELSFLDSQYISNKEKIVDFINFLDKLKFEYLQYNIELPFDTKDLKEMCSKSLDIQEIEKQIDVYEVRIALLRDKYEILKNKLENICNKIINISEIKEYFSNDEKYLQNLIDITKLHDNTKLIYECTNRNTYNNESINTINNNEYTTNFNGNQEYLQKYFSNPECINIVFKDIKNINFIKKYILLLKNNQSFKNLLRKYEILNCLQNIEDFDMKVILLELISNKEIKIEELVNKYQLDKIEIVKKIYILDYKKIVTKDTNNNVIKLNISF
ncbi:hypothetical protein CWI37_1574p0010 [Hamiltosporidium tvaerminnensis]|uniref:Uncharacterized protein n=1 Tax=Hamiltosporidium tvaerminnensis TaxID=1176355 RepID=A0A4Q9KW52_9MICR|nr:hypothetical protein LUQ84_002967 [Hamiltosporidium tvaerminnensis]TBT98834.1 hypothetical protein CWI37_1574p0010 [Hamiltosporidium tvaerminnensis]